MSRNYDRIKTSIDATTLSGDDKKHMHDVFATVDDDSLAGIAHLFEKDSKWVERVNESRKMKQKALETMDESLWNEILEKQKKYLNDLTYGLD